MIWCPFNLKLSLYLLIVSVVTHQWSGDPSMDCGASALHGLRVVTHQWSGDPSILCSLWITSLYCRNSPMIWWPFNHILCGFSSDSSVVTHQWSGDPSIINLTPYEIDLYVVTHQWSGDPSIISLAIALNTKQGRNSPMIWWPFNFLVARSSPRK